MDFIDEAKIYIKAGSGGDGCISFRREKYEPKGGPDGGDGGHGGSVIFIANHQLSTLQDFKYRQHYEAESGNKGGGAQKTGRSGEDLLVEVPVGTLLKRQDTGEVIKDLNQDGERFRVAKGGRGGKGNLFFTTSTNQAPFYSQDGKPGDEFTLLLELKLLADVALVGFPNAGKSTLISAISAAKPKVAAYPFTTLTPHLGVVELGGKKDRKTFVVADIPGLIEGAHDGKGLGIRFLKHLERSLLLWFVLDPTDLTVNPLQAFEILRRELSAYKLELGDRPYLVVINKMDLNPDPKELKDLRAHLKKGEIPFFEISAHAHQGLDPLLWETQKRLEILKRKP